MVEGTYFFSREQPAVAEGRQKAQEDIGKLVLSNCLMLFLINIAPARYLPELTRQERREISCDRRKRKSHFHLAYKPAEQAEHATSIARGTMPTRCQCTLLSHQS